MISVLLDCVCIGLLAVFKKNVKNMKIITKNFQARAVVDNRKDSLNR